MEMRFRADMIYPGQLQGEGAVGKVAAFANELVDRPAMLLWTMAQSALLLLRVVQLVGAGSGLLRRDTRPLTVLLLAGVVAFAAVAVGIGNPRYRTPLEPFLIILTLMGWDVIRDFARRNFPGFGQAA